jgi:glycosyltransferase involved in cell wall biosynthesis
MTHAATHPPVDSPRSSTTPAPLRSLQLGVGWLPEQSSNGLDRVYHALIRHLPAAGDDVQGLVMGSDAVRASSLDRVRAVAPETAALLRRLWALRRAVTNTLAETPVDVVAAHFALYAAPVLDRLRSQPFVVHFHGPWADESAVEGEAGWKVGLKARLERAVYHRADRLIVLSDAFRHVLVDRYDVPAERIRIVPGGVDVDAFDTGGTRADARARLGWPTDRPIVLAVRRLVRRVGLDRLIDSMVQVRTQVPDALLLIAGSGPLRNELTEQIESLGLNDHVRLLGYVPDADLPFAYRAADVSVVPTLALEGFGLVAVESLAAGTPVFVTPVGGLPDIVTDLAPRLILANGTPDTIGLALSEALTDPTSLPSAEACRHYAATHFDWSTVAARVRAVYQELT